MPNKPVMYTDSNDKICADEAQTATPSSAVTCYNLDFGPCDVQRRLETIAFDFNSSEMFSPEYYELKGYKAALEWVLNCMKG